MMFTIHGRLKLSRGPAVFAFWLLGFGIGFLGWLSLPHIVTWFSTLMPALNQSVIGALMAGIVGSAVSTFTIITWANKAV